MNHEAVDKLVDAATLQLSALQLLLEGTPAGVLIEGAKNQMGIAKQLISSKPLAAPRQEILSFEEAKRTNRVAPKKREVARVSIEEAREGVLAVLSQASEALSRKDIDDAYGVMFGHPLPDYVSKKVVQLLQKEKLVRKKGDRNYASYTLTKRGKE